MTDDGQLRVDRDYWRDRAHMETQRADYWRQIATMLVEALPIDQIQTVLSPEQIASITGGNR